MAFASALSALTDSERAVRAAAESCAAQLAARGARCDLAVLWFSSHHVEQAATMSAALRQILGPTHALGISGESVISGAQELERTPGVSVLAASLPGVRLAAFTSDAFPPLDADEPEHVAVLSGGIGAASDTAATLIFADPFSIPVLQMIPAFNRARRRSQAGAAAGVLVGGLASAARAPGGNALFVDDRVRRFGAVGVTLSGPLRVDTIVSQGCRAVGEPLVITRARNNLILQLAGRPARDVMREVVSEMSPPDRGALSGGLFVGRVINEYKERFGRNDFLIRSVVGEDPASGAIAVADFVRVGQTVQFHVRDADTASQDLSLLLDAQRLHDPPAGAMLVTCNGRGTRLFSKGHHDAGAISRAFTPLGAGEQLAKPGSMIASEPVPGAPVPGAGFALGGFFAAGEIGPVGSAPGSESYLHANTACVTLFRPGLPTPPAGTSNRPE